MRVLCSFLICFLVSIGMAAQEITSFQGMWGDEFYQDADKISWKEVDKIMKESTVAEQNWQKYKKQSLGGLVAGAANLGATIWFVVEYNDDRVVTAPAIAAIGTAVISSIFFNSAKKNKKEAILKYNASFDNTTTFKLVPVSNSNGMGIALQF